MKVMAAPASQGPHCHCEHDMHTVNMIVEVRQLCE